ncbi:hypothetical protein BC936DRAFT_144687 [Jimgerdemannia flammicorona]|uniref:Uncharacterized protein n=1 Tax=Jimgerdemannia flammicorona TaxID=994334 RepID=A0A433DBY0_9FUNG|nr:hypothetical protein BC936DRAFT_144687 [Jimgerdemannia flammicorona]
MRVKHCYFRPAKLLAPSRPEKENPPQKSFENDLEFGIFDAAWVFSGESDTKNLKDSLKLLKTMKNFMFSKATKATLMSGLSRAHYW